MLEKLDASGCPAMEMLLTAFLWKTYVLHCRAIIYRFRKRCDGELSRAQCQTLPKRSWIILVVVQSAFKCLPTQFCVDVSILISTIFLSRILHPSVTPCGPSKLFKPFTWFTGTLLLYLPTYKFSIQYFFQPENFCWF